MNGEGAALVVVVEFHLGGIVAGLTVDEITDSGVFDDHFGPEGVSGEAEKVGALVGDYLHDDVGPAGEDVGGLFDLMIRESIRDDLVEGIFWSEKVFHIL